MTVIRTFDKDYRYLLTNLIPLHRLSRERRRQIRDALTLGDAVEMRLVAVLALEDLYEADYFDRFRTQDENGHVVLTYMRSNGSYQIRLSLPSGEWKGMSAGKNAASVSPPVEEHVAGLPGESLPTPEIIDSSPVPGRDAAA